MANLNWNELKGPIKAAFTFFQSQGVKPTLRTLYYNLVSQNLIPNTKTSYQCLSKKMVEWRKAGVFPMDILEDKVRMSYGTFQDSCFSEDHEKYQKAYLDRALENFNIESILKDFFNYRVSDATVSKWANQPEVCEIWIEKDALASTVVNWTSRKYVTVRVNKGYSSLTFIYNNAQALEDLLTRHDKVTILYLGDLDPSGVDMERYLKQSLQEFGLDSDRVELKRLGLTVEQVEEYKLPPKPEDAETLAKLQRDPRNKTYDLDYVVELDSLVAYVPEEFKRVLLEAIDEIYDIDVYNDLKQKAEEINSNLAEYLAEIKAKAKEKMKEFLNE
jgi:5S rRNA maturation endonuclease (ribonuclease M5)